MRIYFNGFIDTDISYFEHKKELESLSMSESEFAKTMKGELYKYLKEYLNENERLKITNVRVVKEKAVE